MRIIVVALLCPLIACGRIDIDPVVPGGACHYNSRTYPSGATFPSGDGCNSCTCTSGAITCTSNACADACAGCIDSAAVDPCASMAGCPSVECTSEQICCGLGESCVGGLTPNGMCVCGAGPPCVLPQTCQVATQPGSVCGSVCQ